MESVKVQQINDAAKAKMKAFIEQWDGRFSEMSDAAFEVHIEELRQASRDAEAARKEERAARTVP